MTPQPLMSVLFAEVLRDSHKYVPGREQSRPTLAGVSGPAWRTRAREGRELARDLIERIAADTGFTHRHFQPEQAATELERLVELREGLEQTFGLLADDRSRRAMIDVLKLRVLGPHHARLRTTPQDFRAQQMRVEREWTVSRGTFEVSDPWFSPLSLYKIPLEDGHSITMHGHSVDLVSVFVLGQYVYGSGPDRVAVRPGDVVFDIGGCWGDTALYFAHLAGPKGKVYTFEFDPESLAILRENLALNPELAKRIEIVERAVWERPGEILEFRSAGRCTTLRDGRPEVTNTQVETTTVDEFARGAGLAKVHFVKMDVEGAEPSALRGAMSTLSRDKPSLAIAAYHKDDDLIALPSLIREAGLDWDFYVESFSPVEEETVLFAQATRANSSK